MLTDSSKYGIFNTTSGMRIFYANTGLLVGAGSLTASLVSTEQSPFLLEEDMRKKKRLKCVLCGKICYFKSTLGKYCEKCRKSVNVESQMRWYKKNPLGATDQKLPIGKWAWKYDRCLICRTIKIKHWAKGLCIECYIKKRYWRNKNGQLARRN